MKNADYFKHDTFSIEFSWAISKAQGTYGLNMLRLDTPNGRFRIVGHGYDMEGAVIAEWLNKVEFFNQSELSFIRERLISNGLPCCISYDNDRYLINGSFSANLILSIFEHVGWKVQTNGRNFKGQGWRKTGFTFTRIIRNVTNERFI